jgi:hypothetical protein
VTSDFSVCAYEPLWEQFFFDQLHFQGPYPLVIYAVMKPAARGAHPVRDIVQETAVPGLFGRDVFWTQHGHLYFCDLIGNPATVSPFVQPPPDKRKG